MRKARTLTLLAMLMSLTVVGRLAFTYIPNVQPTTSMLIILSFLLGPLYAVVVAVGSTFITNLFLGMGIWTIWQMLAWSIVAIISGVVGKYRLSIPPPFLAMYAGFCGLLYGFLVSVPLSKVVTDNFWAYYLVGIPMDIMHAIGNIVFFIILYPLMGRLQKQYSWYMKKT